MSALSQIANIFGAWPGDLVYRLIILFAVEVMVALAFSHGRRLLWPAPILRVLQAGLVLTFGQVLLILAAAISRLVDIPAEAVLPPLDRFVEIVSLALLGWAFVPLYRRSRWGSYALGLFTPIAALVIYAFLAPRWYLGFAPGAAFNQSLQNIFWGLWGLALAGAAATGVLLPLIRPRPGGEPWGQTLIAFVFILAGYLLHLIFPNPALSAAAWVRWGLVVAYPLLLSSFYQQTSTSTSLEQPAAELCLPAVAGGSATPWLLWEGLRLVSESADSVSRAGALQKTSQAMASTLGAGLVAVGLPGPSPDAVELLALCCPGQSSALGGRFQLESQPTIKRAITRKQGLPITAQGELAALNKFLGNSTVAALWAEPILHARQALGVLLVGKDKSASEWSPADIQNIHAYTAYLSSALHTAIALESATRQNQTSASQLTSLESQLAQSQANTEAQMVSTRTELQQAKAELGVARQQITHYRKQVDDLAALVQLQDNISQRVQAGQEMADEAWVPIQKLSDLLLQRHELENQVSEWQLEAARLMALQKALEDQTQKAQQQIATLQGQLEAARPPHLAYQRKLKGRSELIAWAAQELAAQLGAASDTGSSLPADTAPLKELIDNLIAISDAEPLLFQREPVNSAELVQEALATAPQCSQRGVSVVLDITADAPTLSADRRSLVQAISLLLSNACRCSLPDTLVTASLRRASDPQSQDYMQLSISDTGRGITSADRPRVFNYRRADQETPIQGLGDNGLGLPVAKLIIEAHDGRIWMDSKLGTGTTFTILLPLAQGKDVE